MACNAAESNADLHRPGPSILICCHHKMKTNKREVGTHNSGNYLIPPYEYNSDSRLV